MAAWYSSNILLDILIYYSSCTYDDWYDSTFLFHSLWHSIWRSTYLLIIIIIIIIKFQILGGVDILN